jgi:two-component system OmpR family sensor kinase/two-component system sensor histidine kinase BaeS
MHMHRHRPKWKDRPPDWPPSESGEEWPAAWAARRRYFMLRFVSAAILAAFFLLTLLIGVMILAFSLARQGSMGPAEGLLVLTCFVVPALIVMIAVGVLAFGRVGSPLADLMAAADTVAAGDLSVRVPERGRGDMARLAGRFNRMTAELERAEEGRRRLTADVAHELRTPLHILQGNLEGVLDGVYEPTRDHVADMLDETRLLARLVDDLQTLSLAESGALPLHRQTLPAADLLEDAVTRFMGAAVDAGVTLKVRSGDDAPVVTVDPDRLDQALSNLVANALRHTPAGGRVELSAVAVPGGVELSVADTGVGIGPADLPHVFDRFWRGDRSRKREEDGQFGGSRRPGGTGLGLPIARRLVEAHGGTIRVESELGTGTTFTIFLPKGDFSRN